MAIIATNTGSSFEPIEAGTYLARCYQMIDLGTQKENYQGLDKESRKVRIGWELPTEMKIFNVEKGEQPQAISKEFTLSMHEKSNLRKVLESWRGKGFTEEEAKSFDITKLIGKPCMLSIIHKISEAGKKYAVISAITTLPKGSNVSDQINPTFEFSLDSFDVDIFNKIPDFMKDKIKVSPEYKSLHNPENSEVSESVSVDTNNVDDLPF